MSETTTESLFSAFVAASGELGAVAFDSKNPFLNNRYASLGALISESRPILSKHGLAIIQTPVTRDKEIGVLTKVIHKSGESMECGDLFLEIGEEKGKSRAQVAGSIVTYLRRYALASVLSLYGEEDTDGHNPSQDKPKAVAREQKPSQDAPNPPAPPYIDPLQPKAPTTKDDRYQAKCRMQLLNKLQAAIGGANRQLFKHFCMSKLWLKADQELEVLDFKHVPKSPDEFAALIEEFHKFDMQQQATNPEIVP